MLMSPGLQQRNPCLRAGLNSGGGFASQREDSLAAISQTSGQIALRDPDTRLMIAVRDDEPGAFEELVEKYQHRLVAVLHHLVGQAQEAEDLAQEVFLRVYRARKKYRARAKFSTWLFTIANNLASNALRNRQRRHVVPLPASKSGPADILADNRA